ncbi:ornithine cyclodeaminase family protein [Aquabacterium humicola]|uniref:ornithine cyclodeaminase family protein n=1 Tax=Aquabacterium humicola TaxID=3237377 RepID=UPI002543C918|nr:ornithine cyclodeaminase family protein [Rubrivivax pictus]
MLISSEQVLRDIQIGQAITAVEQALLRMGAGLVSAPVSMGVAVADGTFHVKACTSTPPDAAGLFVAKINANFPANSATGRPTIQGAIAVFDTRHGDLLAIVDSPSITALRTAATTALVIRHLAPRDARVATVVGCGMQGRFHLEALQACGIQRVHLFDTVSPQARALAQWARVTLGINCEAVDDMRRATLASRVIVTCTPSRQAFLGADDVGPGTLVAAVGADNEGKSEIDPALLTRARVVTDLTAQCLKAGDLHHAPTSVVCGELADVVAGRVARTAADDIVVFDSTGLAVQDLALCELLVSARPPFA